MGCRGHIFTQLNLIGLFVHRMSKYAQLKDFKLAENIEKHLNIKFSKGDTCAVNPL